MARRKVTDVEKFYILNNRNKSVEEIAEQLDGIGPRTVEKILMQEGEVAEPEEKEKELPKTDPNQNAEDRKQEVANLDLKSGDFLAQKDGATVMTANASEISDANRSAQAIQAKKIFEKNNSNCIHRIKKNKKKR